MAEMKNATAIFFSLLLSFLLKAQDEFKTIVPGQPVVVGESFRVQYIFPGTSKIQNFKNPSFRSFRFVSGPDQYPASVNSVNGKMPGTNFVFTLEAGTVGRFKIPGATATINGKIVRTNDAWIEVIPQQQAGMPDRNAYGNSEYFLRPGEDPYSKIKQNLFLKVMVDRNTCFAGEPILATFKLYSRLQSRSDIVKNPGFYGFTVYDMVNLSDKETVTEEINGKLFDVHTIRKVQLFPLQEGLYTIDAMEVVNNVEFSRSVVNKRTEQEIIEGVLTDDGTEKNNENTEVYETKISTEPISIRVKALPNKPATFDGAVGRFSISSALVKNKIARNEEGVLEIIIDGQGNFTQLNAPVINWPAGIEGFEPVVKDAIDKTQMPLKGSRTFRYSFTATDPGQYQLPAVGFTYFDPGGFYKTVSSSPVTLEVGAEIKKPVITEEKKTSIRSTNAAASKIAVIIIVSLVAIVMIYWIRYKKEPESIQENKVLPTVEELLEPAYASINTGDQQFYATLHSCTWNFFLTHFHLSGSDMKKEMLMTKMSQAGIMSSTIEAVRSILKKCEAGMFTKADMEEDKASLLDQTKALLSKIDSDFFQAV